MDARARDAVKSRLRELGWSQKELADRLSVREATVSEWIRGHSNPSFESLVRLRDVLGVDPTIATPDASASPEPESAS